MTKEFRSIDVSGIPELLRIAEEVDASGEARVLRRDNEDLAVLMPANRIKARPRRSRTRKDLEAFRASAGSWKHVDVDKFLEDNEASRQVSARPPVEL